MTLTNQRAWFLTLIEEDLRAALGNRIASYKLDRADAMLLGAVACLAEFMGIVSAINDAPLTEELGSYTTEILKKLLTEEQYLVVSDALGSYDAIRL